MGSKSQKRGPDSTRSSLILCEVSKITQLEVVGTTQCSLRPRMS